MCSEADQAGCASWDGVRSLCLQMATDVTKGLLLRSQSLELPTEAAFVPRRSPYSPFSPLSKAQCVDFEFVGPSGSVLS